MESRTPKPRVSVWRVKLDLDDPAAEALRGHLSADELERLDRLQGSEVGQRWLASRAGLREILADALGATPSSVQVMVDADGRPGLDPGAHRTDLDFNLSHSGDLALVATANGMRVGVDVERLRDRDPLRVADRYFSEAEMQAVRGLPEADRPLAFLRYWTAKEALAKGLGPGLKAPGGELELAQGADGAMVAVHHAPGWRLVELTDLPDGYCAALAVDDPAAQIAIRDWPLGAAPR